MKMIATDSTDSHAPIWPIYRALVGIATLCGLLIVGVYLVTRPVIEAKRATQLEQAVFRVLPGAVKKSRFNLSPEGVVSRGPATGKDDVTLYAGYDDSNALVGIALQASGMGYQDAIGLLYGYSPDQQRIIGMQVLDSRETPGLGDRIEKDRAFLENFAALDVRVDTGTGTLLHPLQLVKHGSKTEAWQIDAITGATISSKAVAGIIAQSSAAWLPSIKQQQHAFVFADEESKDDAE